MNSIFAAFVIVSTIFPAQATHNSSFTNDPPHQENFIPEQNWKPIKPGQKVPGGLHYRINLKTGEKEAKLLSDTEDSASNEAALVHHPTQESKKDQEREELVQFLEKFKKALKTESELMISLLQDYQTTRDDKVKCDLLQKIEFLVHKYDVGRDFVTQSGLQLLLPDLNSSSPHVRANVAFVLGSAMQGNPHVQSAVMGEQGLPLLLHLVMADPHPEVKLRSLYALSCLLRQNPLAQEVLLARGAVSQLLQACRTSPKLQRKALTLFSDLVNEQKLHLQHQSAEKESSSQDISLNIYKKLKLVEQLVEHGFCEDILRLLRGLTCQFDQDLDLAEKVVEAMSSLHPACRTVFAPHQATLRPLLSCQNLSDPYSQMARVLRDSYLPSHGGEL